MGDRRRSSFKLQNNKTSDLQSIREKSFLRETTATPTSSRRQNKHQSSQNDISEESRRSTPRDSRIKSYPDNSIAKLNDNRVENKKGRSESLGTSNQSGDVFSSNSHGDPPNPRIARKWSSGVLVAKAVSIVRKGKMDWSRAHQRMDLLAAFGQATSHASALTTAIEKRRHSKDIHKDIHRKRMLEKFRLAVKLTIYCIRLFKAHSLRNKEQDDEISPFIKGLHFYEDEPVDLMFAKNDYKANRSLRISEETKRILCKRPSQRTDHELYSAQIALRNIKAIAEYPQNMQRKIAEVGQYERYEAKRILLRQGHPASAYYFVLSGQAVVMVMDASHSFARPALYYNKGGEFGELAIIQESKRNATIICKEACELLSISKRDYKRIFMMGGEKSIGDPDQEQFIRSLNFLDGWPIHRLKEQPDKSKFLYFKRGDVVTQDTAFYDWLIVVKTGSIRVLKKLKKVVAFEWKRKKPEKEFVSEKTKRINMEKREVFRRHVLSEIKIPLRNIDDDDANIEEYPGKPRAFQHPPEGFKNEEQDTTGEKLPDIKTPRNKTEKHKRNSFQSIQGQFLPSLSEDGQISQEAINQENIRKPRNHEDSNNQASQSDGKRRKSVFERERELMGFKEQKRTIQDDIDGGKRKDPDDMTEADLKPEFVEIQTLSKGQVFGLSDIILDTQPNFCIVSNGADLILLDKEFYLHHSTDSLKNRMRQELCPYPTDEEMQERLQQNVDWSAYRKSTMTDTLGFLKAKRELRASLSV